MNDPAGTLLNLYTPQRQSEEQLLAEFIDRKGILARILGILRQNTADKPQQHVVLIGPRGMGKTTLLCAIHYSVKRDPGLAAEWLPVQFAEEQYNIGDLADFWLEALRRLEQVLDRPPEAADRLLDENPADLPERAQQRFFEILAETGKRALLLVDNLHDTFAAIDDGQALHKLRALWMTDPRMTVVGTAPGYFEEITGVDQAFHDFFRSFALERLNQAEMETALHRYAEILGDDTVPKIIEQAPERVAALRILTGGNPRLVKLGYRILRDRLDGDVRQDLESLLDQATPFFKNHIDGLAKEARRAFDAMARRWDPVTVDDIRKELRKPSNYVSALIKRLIDEGFVEEVGGEKKKLYQVSERFYNVYHLWRLTHDGRWRLRSMACFIQAFYGRKDGRKPAPENKIGGGVSEPARAEGLSRFHALRATAAAGAFDEAVRDTVAANDPGAGNLDALLTDLLQRAAAGERAAVRDALLALDETAREPFEPLLLALKALDDRAILGRIAREKRELVQDVMRRIEETAAG
jgi:Holliday junction resolvasome RuvABC ATP-dependent DNA helicase subunit